MNEYRIWQIDFLRGTAVLSMLFFNYSYTLRFFNLLNFTSEFYWFWVPRIIAGMFIFISGTSTYISIIKKKNYIHVIKRGLKIFFLGIVITLTTFIFFNENTIWFGILHLIGISIILSIIFYKFEKSNYIIGLIIIVIGITLKFSNPYLFWVFQQEISSFDYEPLFPWFGIFLLGIASGKYVYNNFAPKKEEKYFSKICFLGRHSLIIYLAHQPFLLIFLFIFGIIKF